ncbi:phosphoribosyltransferase [Neorhizobium galegae]|uniref:Phosphoribosyltransferase n=1 Tax=Neorhizobium galegae bv. orientalis str. HAMBI 540 TaxID=1028800 RepID=A0A068STB4_NEOGA|nr:phosphoribosyltransferase [Neorhizobium galegae]CDN49433.1 Phosphoribosyltransferase [Neorhizobium galegae bv. orientalis str. HAMBI 540]CDZ47153.1 PRPP-binding protein, adenine/guanine phosphoribosyltransferase [Neorhizobium galegae bv. orientalis]
MQPHDFWQDVHPAGSFDRAGPFSSFFPATLDDGSQIRLPIRPLADGEHALASLIINQASFDVQDALAADLAPKIAAFRPEVIVGLPTLGLTLAAAVARALGHLRYVPLGTSRKFWYDENLSVPLSSITTPEQQKRLYVDPRMLPLIKDKRVALIDDVISSGTSIVSGLTLMASLNIEPVVVGAAMLQSERWHDKLDAFGVEWRPRVTSGFRTPMLKKAGEGSWMA